MQNPSFINALMDRAADWHTASVSLFIHFLLILIFGGTVLFQSIREPDDFTAGAEGFLIENPDGNDGADASPPAGSSVDAALAAAATMATVVAPTTPTTAMLTTTAPSTAFQVASSMPSVNTTAIAEAVAAAGRAAQRGGTGLGGSGWGRSSGRASWGSGFGSREQDDLKLTGTLYDLKRTADGKDQPGNPTETRAYFGILQEFIQSRFNASTMSRFYRASAPLYNSHLFLPGMAAEEGPKAFGMEKEVQPRGWFIHYKGGITPPVTGRYRFWGVADDVLVVAINGRTVFDASLDMKPSGWTPPENSPTRDKDGYFAGEWVDLSDRMTYRIDILIGERPGGRFSALLFVEREGQKVARDDKGRAILPLFTTLPLNISEMPKIENAPKIADKPAVMTPKQNALANEPML